MIHLSPERKLVTSAIHYVGELILPPLPQSRIILFCHHFGFGYRNFLHALLDDSRIFPQMLLKPISQHSDIIVHFVVSEDS